MDTIKIKVDNEGNIEIEANETGDEDCLYLGSIAQKIGNMDPINSCYCG